MLIGILIFILWIVINVLMFLYFINEVNFDIWIGCLGLVLYKFELINKCVSCFVLLGLKLKNIIELLFLINLVFLLYVGMKNLLFIFLLYCFLI